ncbi:MAG: tRNA 5-methoxyuridine(34)/uridine 5-oxyacetic acid(34) synthase CmoB [Gammaproteobacteria bacterium]|nr:tRNA 5-methoxyuridine(34)/uridine 5-oxyacetic acid(34) synthase CmoB [Gammaproteobacteria bacterium]
MPELCVSAGPEMKLADDIEVLRSAPLGSAGPALCMLLERCLAAPRHGDAAAWEAAIAALPELRPSRIELAQDVVRIGLESDATAAQRTQLETALQALHPWRKGPFSLFGVTIDSEWRSDRKWCRLQDHIAPLAGRVVLDVGCGNGYYIWRMLGAGARFVLGVDPTLRFLAQFLALRPYMMPTPPAVLLPLRGEDLPPRMGCFDTVFSMGVIYHRRAPLEHLAELLEALRPGGELVLETLVIPGDAQQVLIPEERYAKMRNVWFIPSAPAMLRWLRRAGFHAARLIDERATGPDEQRATPWMRFESLADFLDPQRPELTVEGYPAPRRALFLAYRPGG